MGNDNKIKSRKNEQLSVTEKELLLFLREELEPLKKIKKVNTYNLETEYAKTKKNVLWSVWIMLGATFVVAGLFTFFLIRELSAKDKKITVNLESFEDLSLKNLFNSLSRTQELYETAAKQHAEYTGALEAKLNQAKLTMDSDLDLLKRTRLSRQSINERSSKIKANYDAAVKAAHEQYDAKIAAAETEMKQYESQLKTYDSENVARAQEWEKKMDSERQVQELERRRLVENYESQLSVLRTELSETRQKDLDDRREATAELSSKYEAEIAELDPLLSDKAASDIFAYVRNGYLTPEEAAAVKARREAAAKEGSAEGASASAAAQSEGQDVKNPESYSQFNAASVISSYPALTESFARTLNSVQTKYDGYTYLSGISSGIPYRNTLKSVVRTEKALANDIASQLADSAAKEISSLASKNKTLSQKLSSAEAQRSVLTDLLNSGNLDPKADGYIISADNPSAIEVFMKDSVKPGIKTDGSTRVTVFDENKKRITTGALRFNAIGYYFSPDDSDARLESGQSIRMGVIKK